jgi:hypothetical protein
MSEITIYHLAEKEVHMVGDYVGVVWPTKEQKKALPGYDGLIYHAPVNVRSGDPYIDFLTIRKDDRRDEFYEDEDSPADGGLSMDTAKQMAEELLRAVEYIKTAGNGKP